MSNRKIEGLFSIYVAGMMTVVAIDKILINDAPKTAMFLTFAFLNIVFAWWCLKE